MSIINLEKLTVGGLRLAIAAPILALIAIVLFRSEVMDYRLPFILVAFASVLAGIALIMCIWSLAFGLRGNRGLVTKAVIGVSVSLAVLYMPVTSIYKVFNAPAIHDVSTDLKNPPVFRNVPGHRTLGNNSLGIYPQVQAMQKANYPYIAPIYLNGSPGNNLGFARAAIEEMGWKIVSVNEATNQIEATDASLFFGFKDDIIVRLTADNEETRVDVRSASRVGVSDLGVNAARIRAYLKKLGGGYFNR